MPALPGCVPPSRTGVRSVGASPVALASTVLTGRLDPSR